MEKTRVQKSTPTKTVPCMAMTIGNTTYNIGLHYNNATKETIEDKVKHLICKDIEKNGA